MDIAKIGKYIAENRKKNDMTQVQLAERLGVTSKTVSRWENGNYMPDISLLKPLSEELGVTLNDLLSGEKVEQEQYRDKLEENILNTIDYTNKKTASRMSLAAAVFVAAGLVCSLAAMTIFPSESSWGSIYAVIGLLLSTVGIWVLTRNMKIWKRLLCSGGFFAAVLALLVALDYVGVVAMHQAPRFRTTTTTTFTSDGEPVMYYDTLFYDVLRTHPGTEEENIRVVPNGEREKYVPD